MAVLQSQLRLSLLDQASGPARAIMGTLTRLRTMAQSQMGFFRGMTGQLAMLTGGAASIYGVAQGFKTAVQSVADFQTAMNRVNALSGATTTQMTAMRKQALELGRTTMFTASQAGDAQGFLAMAGFKANDIMGAMPGTLQLATAAQMDLARTADVVTNILTGYNMKVEELGRVNDVLVKAFTSANVDLTMLAESMKYAGPIATSAGVRFEEATAALSLMGNAGIQGSMAGTSLRGAITRVLNPTKQITKAMKRAGVRFTDTEGRLLPLAEIVQQLEPHAEDTGLMMELFGQRAGPAMAALVTQGSQKLRELDRELQNSGGTAARVADVQMQGFNGRMLEMRSALEGLMIALGDRIIPHLTPIVQKLTGVFGELNTFIESLDKRISVFDKMKAAFDAFAVGMGGTGFTAWLSETGAAWRDSIFGKEFGEGEFEAVNNLARISNQWRAIGRNFRAFMDDMSAGNLTTALGGLWDAFKEMPTFGKMAVLFAMAKGISLLSASLVMLVSSPWVRGVMALYGIATAIEMFANAESFTEFVNSLKELSAIEWAGIGAGMLLLLGPLRRIMSMANRTANALRGVGAASKAAAGGRAAAGAASGGKAAAGAVGAATAGGGGVLGLLAGTIGGKATIAAALAYGIDRIAQSYRDVIGDAWFANVPSVTGSGFNAPAISAREAESQSMLDWNRYKSSGDFQDDMEDRSGSSSPTSQINEKAPAPAPASETINRMLEDMRRLNSHEQIVPSPADAIRGLGDILGSLTPQSDPLPTLESIRDAVGRAPAGTHEVREINPTPVHAPINVTVYATTMADANQIASQVGARVQDALSSHYSDGALA